MRLTDTQVEFREQEGREVSIKATKWHKIQIFLNVKIERLAIFAEISPLKNEVFKRVK